MGEVGRHFAACVTNCQDETLDFEERALCWIENKCFLPAMLAGKTALITTALFGFLLI